MNPEWLRGLADIYHTAIDDWAESMQHAPSPDNEALCAVLSRKLNGSVTIQHATKEGWELKHYVIKEMKGVDGTDYVSLRVDGVSDGKPLVQVKLDDIQAVNGIPFGATAFNPRVCLWRRGA